MHIAYSLSAVLQFSAIMPRGPRSDMKKPRSPSPFLFEAQSGGGLAEHFHNTVEEMSTILIRASCLTVDSHTSLI